MRGLESLIPPKKQFTPENAPRQKDSIFLVETDNISPNPYQPRKEFIDTDLRSLADSISIHGILQPLLVDRVEEDVPTGRKVRYELVAGERRLRAAKMAGLPHVPVVIRRVKAGEKLELSLIENIQRSDLNPMEEALAYKQLQDEFGMSQVEIAARVGKSRPVIANAIRMLRLPQEIQDAVRGGIISDGHTRPLLALETEQEQRRLFEEIVKRGLTVRDTETRAQDIIAAPSAKALKRVERDGELDALEKKLKTMLAARVMMRSYDNKARIAVEFSSRKDLVAWVKRLVKEA